MKLESKICNMIQIRAVMVVIDHMVAGFTTTYAISTNVVR